MKLSSGEGRETEQISKPAEWRHQQIEELNALLGAGQSAVPEL